MTTWGSNNITFSGDIVQPISDTGTIVPTDFEDETPIQPVPQPTIEPGVSTIESIAFILIAINAADNRRIGLINQLNPSMNANYTTAFNYLIQPNDNQTDIITQKVLSDAGFSVTPDNITQHSRVLVLPFQNQFCTLYSVEVDKLQQQGTLIIGNSSSVSWLAMTDIPSTTDWMCQTIIMERMMSKNGMVFISNSTT